MSEYKIYTGDSAKVLKELIDNGVQVDLTVTSSPYDDLITYSQDDLRWNFNKFKKIAQHLYDITKTGDVVVWYGFICIEMNEEFAEKAKSRIDRYVNNEEKLF